MPARTTHPVTVEVEAKRCSSCGLFKPILEFYERRDGKRESKCIPCESSRRAGDRTDRSRRKREYRAGRRPRISEQQKRDVVRIFKRTGNKSEAARQAMISRNSVDPILEEHERRTGTEVHLEPDPLPFDQLSERARRGVEDFAFFDREYNGYDPEPWEVELATELLEAYYSDVDEYLVVNVCPGAGKSTLVTYRFVRWVVVRERALGREPRIQLGHRAEAKAKWYIKRLRMQFTRDAKLIEEYGRFKPEDRVSGASWTETELMIEPLDWAALRQKEPTLSAGSYEGSVLSGRYKLIIWDDIVDKSNSRSQKQREDLVDFIDQEAETRLDAGGLFVLCGARYGPEDLFHNRLSLEDIEEVENGRPKRVYRRVIYKAHYDEICNGETHRPAYPNGCLLTARVPWFKVRGQRSRSEQRYRLVWQQEDVDPVGTLADVTWFRGGTDHRGWRAPGCFDAGLRFGVVPSRQDAPVLSVVTVDPSAARFWAVTHFLIYDSGERVVFNGERRPLNAPDLIYREADGRFTGVLEDWWHASVKAGVQFRYLIVETRSTQKWLAQYEFVRTWLQLRNVVLIPHDTNNNKTDPDRGIENCGPVYRDGRLRIPYFGHEEKLWADAFQREATSWPEGSTDDMLMGHWFLEFHLPMLLNLAVEPDYDVEQVPSWARQTAAPAWANKRMEDAVA